MNRITKTYSNLKAAHRQWKHPGHCAGVHGENWSIAFTFEAQTLDSLGFVVDFGDLRSLGDFLNNNFDHTLLLDQDDPALPALQAFKCVPPLARIIALPSASAEGIAHFVSEWANQFIVQKTNGRVRLHSVTVFEDDKNSATYTIT